MTAKVYTDVPALSLHTEIAKLPWIGAKMREQTVSEVGVDGEKGGEDGRVQGPRSHERGYASESTLTFSPHTGSLKPASKLEDAQIRAQKCEDSGRSLSLADLCDRFIASVNVSDDQSFSRVLSSLVTSWQKDDLAARAGIEPVTK